jgi:hypothetical protein
MTNEDLTRMAHEAGMVVRGPFVLAHLRDFAALVAAAEREACARVADQADDMGSVNQRLIKRRIAAAIRARGENK